MTATVQKVRANFRKVGGRAAENGYDVEIGAGALARLGEIARRSASDSSQPARRALVVSNRRVFDLYGAQAVRSLRGAGFATVEFLIGDGERYKTLRTAEHVLRFLSTNNFERTDLVVALGGGVVGDLAGFVAAVFLRGVPFIQVPTTLLAQIDASIGGKTGVNTSAGKNVIGAFHQPRAVLIDTLTLRTLPKREMVAGWCEAIKHGAVGDVRLFERTRAFIAENRKLDDSNNIELAHLVGAHCRFKARIVAGDERETTTRTDNRSRRILNFGHTVGHALEQVTGFRRFRHGEAVGIGMLVACEISVRTERLDMVESERLRAAIHATGRFPQTDDLDPEEVMSQMRTDKKSSGGHIQWVLLERLGRAQIVSDQFITPKIVRASLRAVLSQSRKS